LSDEQLKSYLRMGVQALVDSSMRTPELKPLYTRTLLQALRQESNRRQSLPKGGAPVVHAPRAGGRAQAAFDAPVPPAEVPKPPRPGRESILGSPHVADAAAGPNPKGGRNAKHVREPPDGAVSTGSATLERVVANPKDFDGSTVVLNGLYRVGTRVSKVSGPDGNTLGWSLPVGRNDGGTICTGETKVQDHDTY